MKIVSRSPDRGSFHTNNKLNSVKTGEKTIEEVQDSIELFKTMKEYQEELEASEEWRKENMEYDLRTTEWIIDKVKGDDVYAQHLYAALCNNNFTQNAAWPILTEKRWSCSWRHAGGIIANMMEKGDYIDWYCSGIREIAELDNDQFQQLSKEQQETYIMTKAYVSESIVTDEIRKDLLKLGWIVIDDPLDNF